jgi:CubicO group peptidase (beta-lactamase class C family)
MNGTNAMNANNNGVVKTPSSAQYGSIKHEATSAMCSLILGRSRLRRLVTYLALLSLCTGAFASWSIRTTYARSDADAAPVAQAQTFDFQSIDAFVNSQMQAMHIPGVALGIVNGDQIVYVKGFGIANASGQRMTAQTPLILGSTSKSFTALAIMQLVEAGKIDLDAPVRRYLPWFQVGDAPTSSTITVRHLLNQVSGIPTRAVDESLTGNGEETLEQMVRALSQVALTAPTGTTYQYSNLNYTTLGLIVQTVAGQSYESYVQQHIFEPLQMAESFTSQHEALQSDHGLATGYRWWYGLARPAELPYLRGSVPAGFLISSVEDMTHYLVAQMNGGRYLDASLLTPSGITQLHTPATAMNGQGDAYGMGWVISPSRDSQGEPSVWHGGDTANFHSDMMILPRKQLGIIVLTNVNGELARTSNAQGIIAQGVQSILLGQQPPSASTFWQRYLLFDATLFLCSVLVLVSVLRLLQRRKQPLKRDPLSLASRLALPLLWEIGLPVALLLALPTQTQASWPLILLYFPDLGYWLLTICFLLLATAALRVRLASARLGKRDMSVPPLLAPPLFKS